MADYELNYPAFGEHVLNAEWMRAEMEARVVRMKVFAEGIAPTSDADSDGDYYRDHFKTKSHKHGGAKHDRAEAILYNDHEAALSIEFGSGPDRPQGGTSPEHATLRKALDAAG